MENKNNFQPNDKEDMLDGSIHKTNKISSLFEEKKQGFKNLKPGTKIAIGITATGVALSIVFAVAYASGNKYGVLFSDLNSTDANTISKILEEDKVEMKIQGNSILVKKDLVDELRLKLSSNITNGSAGFEIMDEGSGFGMTEEEFEIKKQRMIQGELERTIKTFPQVSDARVHITPGEESVFAKDNKPGSSAVYLTLHPGQQLKQSQVMSIVSLVSASSVNIPKNNVEVIDQNMTLLSEGMFDDEGNFIENKQKDADGLSVARNAEKEFNEDLEKSIVDMLGAIFGKNNVKVSVNTNLNFDSTERTQIKMDPENVISKQTISENSTNDNSQTGSPVDNNMSNTANQTGENSKSKESSTEYEVGKTETHTIVAPGEIQKITASVAINGVQNTQTLENIQEMVETAIGLNANRGDKVTVLSMNFDTSEEEKLQAEKEKAKKEELMKKVFTYGGAGVGVIALALLALTIINKRRRDEDDDFSYEDEIDTLAQAEDIINKVISESENNDRTSESLLEGGSLNNALEEEIRAFATKNPEQTTELIKIWLNED